MIDKISTYWDLVNKDPHYSIPVLCDKCMFEFVVRDKDPDDWKILQFYIKNRDQFVRLVEEWLDKMLHSDFDSTF